MAFQITGKLELIGATTPIAPKNGGQTFYRREFVLDCTRFNPDTGDPWENHPKFELSGQNCTKLDGFQLGQKVTVDFSLKGAKYTDQAGVKYYTTINAFNIALVQQQPQPQPQGQVNAQPVAASAPTYSPPMPQPQPMPAYQQQPMPQPMQQPGAPQVDAYGNQVGPDGLPF